MDHENDYEERESITDMVATEPQILITVQNMGRIESRYISYTLNQKHNNVMIHQKHSSRAYCLMFAGSQN